MVGNTNYNDILEFVLNCRLHPSELKGIFKCRAKRTIFGLQRSVDSKSEEHIPGRSHE